VLSILTVRTPGTEKEKGKSFGRMEKGPPRRGRKRHREHPENPIPRKKSR